jgi:hypothetical protein
VRAEGKPRQSSESAKNWTTVAVGIAVVGCSSHSGEEDGAPKRCGDLAEVADGGESENVLFRFVVAAYAGVGARATVSLGGFDERCDLGASSRNVGARASLRSQGPRASFCLIPSMNGPLSSLYWGRPSGACRTASSFTFRYAARRLAFRRSSSRNSRISAPRIPFVLCDVDEVRPVAALAEDVVTGHSRPLGVVVADAFQPRAAQRPFLEGTDSQQDVEDRLRTHPGNRGRAICARSISRDPLARSGSTQPRARIPPLRPLRGRPGSSGARTDPIATPPRRSPPARPDRRSTYVDGVLSTGSVAESGKRKLPGPGVDEAIEADGDALRSEQRISSPGSLWPSLPHSRYCVRYSVHARL